MYEDACHYNGFKRLSLLQSTCTTRTKKSKDGSSLRKIVSAETFNIIGLNH